VIGLHHSVTQITTVTNRMTVGNAGFVASVPLLVFVRQHAA